MWCKKGESLVLNYLDFSPFTAVLLLIISPNPTQAAPASSELSSELSSRTEVAEWHSTYNTSELAFPETGKPFLAMLSFQIPSYSITVSVVSFYPHTCRLLLPVPALWRGWPDHHQRALPQLHLPQPDADVLPQVQHNQHHLCQICHANKFHQGVPVHQTSGSELCGGEEGQPVLSDHILPPRSVSSHNSDSQKT